MAENRNIRINYYDYIHYSGENYSYKTNQQDPYKYTLDTNKVKQSIEDKYKEMLSIAENRTKELDKNMPTGVTLLDFANEANKFIQHQYDNKIFQDFDASLINTTFQGISDSARVASILKKCKDAQEKASVLNDYLNQVEEVLKLIDKIDDNIKRYYDQCMKDNQSQASMINTLYSNPGAIKNFTILNVNKTGFTSFNNLRNKIDALKKTAMQSGGTKFVNRKIKYQKISDGKTITKTTQAIDSIYGITYQIRNIQGAVGEGISAWYAVNTSTNFIKDFEKSLAGQYENVRVQVSGVGNEQMNGITSKADNLIQFLGDNVNLKTKSNKDITEVLLELKVSTKGIYYDQKSGSTRSIKFLETYLGSLLDKVDKLYSYYMLNGLRFGHNKNTNKSHYYYWISRYIAAANFDNAVTGLNDSKVMLLAFLDRMITIDELYNTIVRTKQYPNISVSGVSKVNFDPIGKDIPEINGPDETPFYKNIHAFQRSERIKNDLRALRARVMWTSKMG